MPGLRTVTSVAKRAKFNHKLYRKLAEMIHARLCEDIGWCNYGVPMPEELRHDASHSLEKRRELAGKRLEWYHHCTYATDAENIAARVQFAKGSKVLK